MTRRLDFRLLGPLEVLDGASPLPLGGRKQRSLLVLLLLHPNEVVPSDTLIDGLWGESPPKTAPTALQVYVSQLRKLLPAERLETRKPGYLLRVDPEELDVARFEGLCAGADGDEPAVAATALGEAISLWRGPALADFAYDSFAQGEIARLEELRVGAIEQRIDADLALGRHAELVGELEALVGEHPLRERLREQLILSLYRAGRQAEALETYRQTRKTLVEEHGIEPGATLKELEKLILEQGAELAPPPAPRRTNLPSPQTRLIGRETEAAEVVELVNEARLVTLTGAGGTGKTRLALQAAAGLVDRYPDGVWWVPLAALRDTELLATTIAQVVGAGNDLARYLRNKQTLLLLDNFEQLLEAGPLLYELLAQTHHVKLLVTSREPLHLSGEREYSVPPLPDHDAVTLFGERARSFHPGFEPDEHVAQICRRLDCLPLAIELAAARVKVLEPSALLERLEHPLLLLTGGARDTPDRQRTLAATIAWSHDLLSEVEQVLFRRLGAFAGGFTLEAAERVCGTDLDTLQSLVDKSLVRFRGDRFAMLETIREYAVERLEESGEGEELRQAHAEFFRELAERAWNAFHTDQRTMWQARLEAEMGNFRGALAWSLAGAEPEPGLRLVWALGGFWWRTGLGIEADRWSELATSRLEGASASLQARVLRTAGSAAQVMNDNERARPHLERALPIARDCGDRIVEVATLQCLAAILRDAGDLEGAIELLESALSVCRELGDSYLTSQTLAFLGIYRTYVGDHRLARAHLEEAISLQQGLGDLPEAAYNIHALADLARETGDFVRAGELYRQSLALHRQYQADQESIGSPLPHFQHGLLESLAGFALAAAGKGLFDRAARLWGAFEALEQVLELEHGYSPLQPFWRIRYGQSAQEACEQEPAALAAGRQLDLDEALAYALADEEPSGKPGDVTQLIQVTAARRARA